jgi:hypothetical protein
MQKYQSLKLKYRQRRCYNCTTSFTHVFLKKKPKNKIFCSTNCKKDFIDKNGPIKTRWEILDV